MKILSIAFKNINSLKGENHIDFEAHPFSGNTLFAITGPTGSGKSSILDVISLALFNQVPRLGKISRKEIREKGAILTRNQKDAYARVTYETGSGRFTSSWSIEVNRNGNLNDYTMEIANLQNNSLLDLKKSEVPAKNEDLIGLNYDQFIKSVLLAQGDFAKFLSAKKEERGELLEKITGTGIYRQLGILAFERFKAETAEIEKQQQEKNLLQSYLLSKEDLDAFTQELKEKSSSFEALQKDLKLIEKQLELKENIAKQDKEIGKLKQEELALDRQLENFENEYGESLKQQEKLQPIAEELKTWQRLNADLKEIKSAIQKTSDKLTENKTITGNFLEQVQSFVHKEVTPENLKTKLQDFSEKIRKLQEEKSSLGSDYKSKLQLFKTETKELKLNFREGNLEGTKKMLEVLKGETNQLLRKLEPELIAVDLESPDSEKNRLKTELEKSRDAAQFSEKNHFQNKQIEKLQEENKAYEAEIASLPKKIEKENNRLISLKKDLKILELRRENQVKTASLEELRKTLQSGDACQLCGSKEHPYTQHLPEFEDDLVHKISAKNSEVELVNRELTNLESKFKHTEDSFQKLNKGIQEIKEELLKARTDFKKKYPDLEIEKAINWQERIDQFKQNLDALERFEITKRKLSAIENGLPILIELHDILEKGKDLQNQLKKYYSGSNISADTQKLMDKWNALLTEKKYLGQKLKEQRKKLQQQSLIFDKLEQELLPQVKKESFESIKIACAALLPGRLFLELKEKKDDFLKQKSIAATSISTLQKQLKTFKEQEGEHSLNELQEENKLKQTRHQELGEHCEALRRKLANNEERLIGIKNLETEIGEQEDKNKRWRLLNTLIGDRQGKKFNDFAQDLTLSQLIYLANIRLKDLSERYKIDKAITGEDDGLVAIDEDMGGQRRSVKTLSGGETFLLSLSLALALSDLASRNVAINSLFIDEGFGTLDPETLDQTLDTLEKLQAESGKTIGIISHVSSLKERIGIQIQLTRNGQGYSSLEVK